MQCASQVFLEQGFEAVSYEQLAAEVGLSKPSLYNAFGDKSAMFARVLEDYAKNALTLSVSQFEGAGTLEEGAKKLLLAAADIYSKPDELSRGCLLVGTALPACAKPGNVRQTLRRFIQSLEGALENTIATRHKADAQNLGRTPRTLALQLGSFLYSLAIRARTGVTRKELRVIAGELARTFTV